MLAGLPTTSLSLDIVLIYPTASQVYLQIKISLSLARVQTNSGNTVVSLKKSFDGNSTSFAW